MMERETDLLNLGICGDGTRMNVVFFERDPALKRALLHAT